MKKSIILLVAALAILCASPSFGDTPGFKKVSDHCYYLQLEDGGANVVVVVSEEGVLMVDPPQAQNLSLVIDALGRITPKAVRWIAFTNPRFVHTAGTRHFIERGALLLGSPQLRALAESLQASPAALHDWIPHIASGTEPSSFRWLIFDDEIRLFPSDLEIQIMALPHKARTGGDLIVYMRDEKVLIVGDLYESARYPDIDTASEGSAIEWVDGLEQVIDSIPVLKSAIPEEGAESEEEEGRTLEEGIAVVSGRGEISNLQNLKDLLEACQRLQRYARRAVDNGRSCDRFLALSATGPYYSYGNLAPYAAQLFEELKGPEEQAQ